MKIALAKPRLHGEWFGAVVFVAVCTFETEIDMDAVNFLINAFEMHTQWEAKWLNAEEIRWAVVCVLRCFGNCFKSQISVNAHTKWPIVLVVYFVCFWFPTYTYEQNSSGKSAESKSFTFLIDAIPLRTSSFERAHKSINFPPISSQSVHSCIQKAYSVHTWQDARHHLMHQIQSKDCLIRHVLMNCTHFGGNMAVIWRRSLKIVH